MEEENEAYTAWSSISCFGKQAWADHGLRHGAELLGFNMSLHSLVGRARHLAAS